jgi:flagellar motility protein MotE (MotC chaperone)
MKPMIIYAGLFVAGLLIATEAVLLLVPHNTQQKAEGTTPGDHAGKLDTTKAKADTLVASADSVKKVGGDSTRVDTMVHPAVARAAVQESKTEPMKETPPLETAKHTPAAADTARPATPARTDPKVIAKLIDMMDAQGAAKILRNMDDKDVKEILLAVKKKQAGKILSVLDPERAARIMR